MKRCTKCGLEKELDQFSKSARAKDGLQWECRSCKNDRAREYYAGDGGKRMRESHKKWLQENREHVNEYSRKYHKGENTHGRGNYERLYSAGIARAEFNTDEEFRKALEKYSERSRRYKANHYINELKSAPCMDCKQIFDSICMDFDHIRGEKKFDISRMTGKGMSLARIQEEIDKCELVCSNCHRIRTKSRILAQEGGISHGSS